MRVAVLMPMRDRPEPATAYALEHYTDDFDVTLLTTRGLALEVARATLWTQAAALDPMPELIVWADADAFWLRGTFAAVEKRLQQLGERVVLGSFHGKRRPYSDLNAYQFVDNAIRAVPIAEAKAPAHGLTSVFFIGSHFMAHRPALFEILGPEPFTIESGTIGEDHSFCVRAIKAGVHVLLDAHLPVFHVEGNNGFLPGRPRFVYRDGGMEPTNEPPSAPYVMPDRTYGERVDAIRRDVARTREERGS